MHLPLLVVADRAMAWPSGHHRPPPKRSSSAWNSNGSVRTTKSRASPCAPQPRQWKRAAVSSTAKDGERSLVKRAEAYEATGGPAFEGDPVTDDRTGGDGRAGHRANPTAASNSSTTPAATTPTTMG